MVKRQLPAAADGDSVDGSVSLSAGSSASPADAERPCGPPVQLLTEDAPAVAAAAQAAGIEEGALAAGVDGPRAAAKNKVWSRCKAFVYILDSQGLLPCYCWGHILSWCHPCSTACCPWLDSNS